MKKLLTLILISTALYACAPSTTEGTSTQDSTVVTQDSTPVDTTVVTTDTTATTTDTTVVDSTK